MAKRDESDPAARAEKLLGESLRPVLARKAELLRQMAEHEVELGVINASLPPELRKMSVPQLDHVLAGGELRLRRGGHRRARGAGRGRKGSRIEELVQQILEEHPEEALRTDDIALKVLDRDNNLCFSSVGPRLSLMKKAGILTAERREGRGKMWRLTRRAGADSRSA